MKSFLFLRKIKNYLAATRPLTKTRWSGRRGSSLKPLVACASRIASAGLCSTAAKNNPLDCFSTRLRSPLKKIGAGNGARTRHLSLGKAALYQMSYSRRGRLKKVWCGRRDLNPYAFRAPEPKSGASANSATPAHRETSAVKLKFGDPPEGRTPDNLIKSQVLYQLS